MVRGQTVTFVEPAFSIRFQFASMSAAVARRESVAGSSEVKTRGKEMNSRHRHDKNTNIGIM